MYADSADLDSDAINLEALETLARVAGMAVGCWPRRSAAAPSQASAPAPAPVEEAVPEIYPAQPSYTPTAEYDELTPVAEESVAGPAPEVTEIEPERAPDYKPEYQPEISPEPQPEVTQIYAEPVVQTPAAQVDTAELGAEIAPPEPVEPAPAPAPPRRRYGADVELPVEVGSEEERRLHNDARRFARLLVSEIKLYNETKVSEGRSRATSILVCANTSIRSREM